MSNGKANGKASGKANSKVPGRTWRDDPRVLQAVRDKDPYSVFVIDCPKCGFTSYWDQTVQGARCRNCRTFLAVQDPQAGWLAPTATTVGDKIDTEAAARSEKTGAFGETYDRGKESYP